MDLFRKLRQSPLNSSTSKRRQTSKRRLGLESLEARQLLAADTTVMFNDHVPGSGTHPNTTSYAANGVRSGLLKDIETGATTAITLNVTANGATYELITLPPPEDSDAFEIFDGFVNMSVGGSAGIRLAGDAIYTHTFSGLDPQSTYEFVGTAVRGDANATDRWTLVTIDSSDSHTDSHSDGNGVVTDGLPSNQAALWTGDNRSEGQGFVVRWANIRPGADGTFSIMSRQYVGPTPGVGSGSASSGSLGYGLEAIRLTEVQPTLKVTSASIQDDERLATAPDSVTINFSSDFDVQTVDAGDLLIDGLPATAVTIDDSDSLTWTLPPLSAGDHTVSISAGVMLNTPLAIPVQAFELTFAVLGPPVVDNLPATNITPIDAEIGGTVINAGGDDPALFVYWGDNDGGTDPAAWDNVVSLGNYASGQSQSAQIEPLQQLTSYFYRIYAENLAGTDWADQTSSFVTPAAGLPQITSDPATSVAARSARLNGSVLETGGDPPSITLYYGDDDGGMVAADWDFAVPLGKRSGQFSHFVTELMAETNYFYRVFAENMAGSVWAPATTTFTTTENIPATVVINEIHIDPDDPTEPVEFIELHNPSDFPVDVSEWTIEDAVDYTFPIGTTISAGGYLTITQNAAAFEAKFGVPADGQWQDGDRLNNDGEVIELRDAADERVDRVDYQLGFPWPTTGIGGRSIELVNPFFENDIGGNWRGASGESGLPDTPQTLVPAASTWQYRKGTSEASSPIDAWRQTDFIEDNTWLTGQTPIGYGDGDDNTVLGDMQNGYSTVYLRNSFTLDEIAPALLVRVYADDGAIVWINGQEVARVSVSAGEKAFNATGENHEAVWEEVFVSNSSALVVGENTVAVHGLNTSLGSSDMSVDVEVIIPAAGAFFGTPSPNARNTAFALNVAPQMRRVDHSPSQPESGEDVTITVKVTDPDGVDSVTLDYQMVEPGNYVRLTDPAYQTSWTTLTMTDDGSGADEEAGDDTYTVVLPGPLQTNRSLVRYRITATDRLSASVTGPYIDDPQPNFAFFVFDGVPDYAGALRPGSTPVETYSADMLNRVATYHLIADATDIQNSQYNNSFNQVQFNGTLVYEGQVYDHIEFRNRGVASTYQVGKNKWKLNFTRGHAFEARDNFGNKYDVPWDKTNFLPGTNPWWRNDVSTEGTVLFEPSAFKLYELAGTPSSHTQFFQFRVVDGANEVGTTQYDGDFWGLYSAIEQPDGRFLNERGLADGNIFNMHGGVSGRTTQRSQGSLLPTDRSDLSWFLSSSTGYSGNRSLQWWEENVNLDSYFAWYAINLVVNNSDLRPNENVNYYHNQETGQWYTLPWDLDLTFEDRPHLNRPDTQWENFQRVFSQHPEIKLAFDNYARELIDLLLDNGEAGQVVAEIANVLTGGETEGTIVQANQAQWDYHPQKRKKGIWYANFTPALLPERTFESLSEYMQDFVTVGGYGRDRLLAKVNESGIPDQPTITYVGPAGFPKSELTFETSGFDDPQGANTFAAMQWRVGEVHNSSVANFDPSEPNTYEIEGTWQSAAMTQFDARIDIPTDAVEVGKTYRARVRFQDADGHWSHWSDPVEFLTTTAPPSDVAQFLRMSEVHYNPASNGDAEFIEFTNISGGAFATTLDLSGVTITDGPNNPFVFPAGTSLSPGDQILVVRDVVEFQTAYPAVPLSQIASDYSGGLSNSGERIRVQDVGGNLIADLDYGDGGLWSQWADGTGGSLVLDDPANVPVSELGNSKHWRGSTETDGSPGMPNEPRLGVVISEVLAHTDPPQQDAIELFNESSASVDISGWYLSDSGDNLLKFEIPAATILEPGEVVVFTEADFNPTPLTPGPNDFALSGSQGDDAWLTVPNGAGGVSQFADEVHFGATFNGQTLGLTAQSDRRLTTVTRNGLGCYGGNPLVADAYIHTINYLPAEPSAEALAIEAELDSNDLEYLIAAGEEGWRIRGGINFDFPATESLGWILSFDPADPANANKVAAFRVHYGLSNDYPLIGGYSGSLSNSGEQLRLERPDVPPVDDPSLTPYVTVDEVIYDVQGDWPTATVGDPIVRGRSMYYGNDGRNWRHQSEGGGLPIFEDFNGDSLVDSTDLDLLIDAVNRGSQNVEYILDTTIPDLTQERVDYFVREVLDTEYGDTNFDRIVNAADLNQVGVHWQQTVCDGWRDGDFTGDGLVTAADLNLLGLNWQQAAAPQAAVGRTPRAALNSAAVSPTPVDSNPSGNVIESSFTAAGSDSAEAGPITSMTSRVHHRAFQSLRRHMHGTNRTSMVELDGQIQREVVDAVFASLQTSLVQPIVAERSAVGTS